MAYGASHLGGSLPWVTLQETANSLALSRIPHCVIMLRKNHRHPGMDLCDGLIRLAGDNRASAQPFSRVWIFPLLPEAGRN
jgi:hypothetical protein